MDPVGHLALALVVILVAGKLGGDLAVRLGQPAGLGELVAGVLIGNLSLVAFSGLEPLKTNVSVDMLSRLDADSHIVRSLVLPKEQAFSASSTSPAVDALVPRLRDLARVELRASVAKRPTVGVKE